MIIKLINYKYESELNFRMKVTYECGDVFKHSNDEYCIIGGTDNGFKFISLKNGFGYDFEYNTEKEITEYINNEGFEYIGRAEDVVSIVYKGNIVKNNSESDYKPTFKHSYVGGIESNFKFTEKEKETIILSLNRPTSSVFIRRKYFTYEIKMKMSTLTQEVGVMFEDGTIILFQKGETYKYIINKLEEKINEIIKSKSK